MTNAKVVLVDRRDPCQLFSLKGRVAIITGGTKGIGRAIAEGFSAAGAAVVVASRTEAACAETAAHIESQGGSALGVPTHLADLSALRRLVDQTVDRFGRLDVVVNNAATGLALPLGEFTEEAWDKSYAVNLRGPVFLVQEALPHLAVSPAASVINVISTGAFTAAPDWAMYAAAKTAMLSFTRSMAAQFASKGVRVNALAPGPVDTDTLRSNSAETRRLLAERTAQRRIATASEMVGPALFLASDAASYVTGQVIVADGGLLLS